MKKSNIGPKINFQYNLCVDPDLDNVEKESVPHAGASATVTYQKSMVREGKLVAHCVEPPREKPKSVKFESDVVVCVFDPTVEVLSIKKTIQYYSTREIQTGMIKNIRKNDQQTLGEIPQRSILKKVRETKSSYSSYEQSSSY